MTAATPLPSDAAPGAPSVNAKDRDHWFDTTPDPWQQIARLEFGGDRSHASTVERIVLDAEPSQRPVLEAKLLGALQAPELTAAGRLFICQMLGWIGGSATVRAVEPLLAAADTADVARLALDGIADPAVDALYRAALGKLPGAARLGLIGSIALRGDVAAVDRLREIAADAQERADVRAGAQRALARLEAKK